jgi:hypothetical protein
MGHTPGLPRVTNGALVGGFQSASVVARGPQTGLYAPRGTPPAVLAGLPKQERQGGAYMQKLVVSEVDRWRKILVDAKVRE